MDKFAALSATINAELAEAKADLAHKDEQFWAMGPHERELYRSTYRNALVRFNTLSKVQQAAEAIGK